MPGTIFEQLFEQFFLNATGAAIRRQINLHLYINKKYYLEKSWIGVVYVNNNGKITLTNSCKYFN